MERFEQTKIGGGHSVLGRKGMDGGGRRNDWAGTEVDVVVRG